MTSTAVNTRVRAAAGAAATGLAAAGALHVVWTRSPWPLDTPADLARVAVGVEETELPSAPLTLAVAGLLGTAGALVTAAARPESRWGRAKLVRAGVWTATGVLAARGAGGLAVSGLQLGKSTPEFRHWDLRLYSPICLTLAGLMGYVAGRTRHA
ncbi:DUF3995 domain-containing protein [Streptomyces bambusae]|uniref:DUF3995 domain-containing protein n=1 Tax=Streptomyces bambusae TaxID=1550616 RepID=A0ABS6ZGI3_9ACTN|nr:DUF3995 domain-containing protein [Streptomyces bambusae]MBW5486859.1 DUF3995 domain-containing protein [Streptomyces bambusae]